MTALAEALLAAQRQAIGALAKPYIDGRLNKEDAEMRLDAIGCKDVTDSAHLFAAWNVLREFGAQPPKPVTPESRKAPEAPTQPQLDLIKVLVREKGTIAPDVVNSKAQASEIITRLQDGTYNADDYTVPF